MTYSFRTTYLAICFSIIWTSNYAQNMSLDNLEYEIQEQVLVNNINISSNSKEVSQAIHEYGEFLRDNLKDYALDSTLFHLRQTMQRTDDAHTIRSCIDITARQFLIHGIYDSSIYYFDKAYIAHAAAGDIKSSTNAYYNIGWCYQTIGFHGRALEYFSNAIDAYSTNGWEQQETRAKINLTRLLIDVNQLDSASSMIDEIDLLFHTSETNNNEYDDLYLTISRGDLALKQADTSLALYHYKLAYTKSQTYDRHWAYPKLCMKLSVIYISLGDLESSSKYIHEIEDKGLIQHNELLGAQLDRVKGLNFLFQEEIDSAKQCLLRSYLFCNSIGYVSLNLLVTDLLIEVYSKTNQTDSLLIMHQVNSNLNQVVANDYSYSQQLLVSSINESIKKNNTIQVLELNSLRQKAEKKNQKTKYQLRISLLVLFGLLIIAFILFFYYRKKRQKESAEYALILSEKREQLKQLEITGLQKDLTSANETILAKIRLVDQIKKDFVTSNNQYALSSEMDKLKILTDADWIEYQNLLEQSYPGVKNRFRQHFESITDGELRSLYLLAQELSFKEIASILGVSYEAVRIGTYRIRKKYSIANTKKLTQLSKKILKNDI